MTRILLLCHDIPSKTVGATIPFYHLIKELSDKYELCLVCFDSEKYSVEELDDCLTDYNSVVIPEYLDVSSQLKYTLRNMFCFDNLHTRSFLNYYYHKDMNILINEYLARGNVDLIISDMPMAFYVRNVNIPKIVYAFDAVSNYNHSMYLKADNVVSKLFWYLNYLKIHNYEKVYNHFDYCVLVNDKDKVLLEKDVKTPIEVIANGVDTNFFENNNEEDIRLVFLGDMSTPPNIDAVRFFVESIYDKVLEKVDIPFFIVGRNPSDYIKSLDDNPNITVTGSVEDVRIYLSKGSIFITPMISGTGIKNKILEAMSMQLPVVSTSIGISGIEAEHDVNYLLADNTDEFVDSIVKLVENRDLREYLGNNARLFVENNYSWKESMHKFEALINSLI